MVVGADGGIIRYRASALYSAAGIAFWKSDPLYCTFPVSWNVSSDATQGLSIVLSYLLLRILTSALCTVLKSLHVWDGVARGLSAVQSRSLHVRHVHYTVLVSSHLRVSRRAAQGPSIMLSMSLVTSPICRAVLLLRHCFSW